MVAKATARFPAGVPRKVRHASGPRGKPRNAMYFVYLLQSFVDGSWYLGYTPTDPFRRLAKHNSGRVQSTKAKMPWELLYYEAYLDRRDATGREKF